METEELGPVVTTAEEEGARGPSAACAEIGRRRGRNGAEGLLCAAHYFCETSVAAGGLAPAAVVCDRLTTRCFPAACRRTQMMRRPLIRTSTSESW